MIWALAPIGAKKGHRLDFLAEAQEQGSYNLRLIILGSHAGLSLGKAGAPFEHATRALAISSAAARRSICAPASDDEERSAYRAECALVLRG